jgi:hypothetical protein
VQSFGEKELYIQTSSTGLSSSECIATTPTPCVTPQPMLPRSEDTVVLKVHGISEAGTVFVACTCKVPKAYNMKHMVNASSLHLCKRLNEGLVILTSLFWFSPVLPETFMVIY